MTNRFVEATSGRSWAECLSWDGECNGSTCRLSRSRDSSELCRGWVTAQSGMYDAVESWRLLQPFPGLGAASRDEGLLRTYSGRGFVRWPSANQSASRDQAVTCGEPLRAARGKKPQVRQRMTCGSAGGQGRGRTATFRFSVGSFAQVKGGWTLFVRSTCDCNEQTPRRPCHTAQIRRVSGAAGSHHAGLTPIGLRCTAGSPAYCWS